MRCGSAETLNCMYKYVASGVWLGPEPTQRPRFVGRRGICLSEDGLRRRGLSIELKTPSPENSHFRGPWLFPTPFPSPWGRAVAKPRNTA